MPPFWRCAVCGFEATLDDLAITKLLMSWKGKIVKTTALDFETIDGREHMLYRCPKCNHQEDWGRI